MNTNEIFSLMLAIVAMLISLISLIYTIKTFLFKNGLYITGYHSLCSDIACEDKYVGKIVLENRKDKAIIIYQIYLQVGYNCFILLDDFEEKPLILGPFEAFSKSYEPIEHYEVSSKCIKLNKLLDDKKIEKNIVLSTSEGKYKVKGNKAIWNPIVKMFKNHMTAVIRPIRIIYKEKSYGSNTRYILEFKYNNDEEEIIPVYPLDYQIKKFKNFQLTQKSLESKENLEAFLTCEKSIGHITCEEFKVLDVKSLKSECKIDENNHYIEMQYVNWFTYNIFGRIATIYQDYKLKRENKKRISKQKKQA